MTRRYLMTQRPQAANGPRRFLAQTLSAPRHLEATDAWSARGRRLFLVALALAGAILLAAGLLITGELGPGAGQPSPLSTGPGNGVADQLLRPVTQEGTTATTAGAALSLPATATTRPAGGSTPSQLPGVTPTPVTTAPTIKTTQSTTPPPSPTTTLPCGILGQGLQSAQVPLPLPGADGRGAPLAHRQIVERTRLGPG